MTAAQEAKLDRIAECVARMEGELGALRADYTRHVAADQQAFSVLTTRAGEIERSVTALTAGREAAASAGEQAGRRAARTWAVVAVISGLLTTACTVAQAFGVLR